MDHAWVKSWQPDPRRGVAGLHDELVEPKKGRPMLCSRPKVSVEKLGVRNATCFAAPAHLFTVPSNLHFEGFLCVFLIASVKAKDSPPTICQQLSTFATSVAKLLVVRTTVKPSAFLQFSKGPCHPTHPSRPLSLHMSPLLSRQYVSKRDSHTETCPMTTLAKDMMTKLLLLWHSASSA